MKRVLFAASAVIAASSMSAPPAHAIGCLSGAAMGAVGGHVAGHHAAVVKNRNAAAAAAQQQQQDSSYQQQQPQQMNDSMGKPPAIR